MITHPNPELLILSYRYDEAKGATLVVEKSISLYDRSPRLAEFLTDVIVHPSGKVAIASCYAGKLRVVTFKAGKFIDDFDVS